MNNYRIEYTCNDGYSGILYTQAANRLVAYMICRKLFIDMSNIVSIEYYLEDEEDD